MNVLSHEHIKVMCNSVNLYNQVLILKNKLDLIYVFRLMYTDITVEL